MSRLFPRILAPFRSLRWRLTLSYTVVTVVALLTVEIVLISGLTAGIARDTRVGPESLFGNIQTKLVPLASSELSTSPPSISPLRARLKNLGAVAVDAGPIRIGDLMLNVYSARTLYVVFVSVDGALIDTLPHDFISNTAIGETLDTSEIPGLDEPLKAALGGETDIGLLHTYPTRTSIVGAVPIFDELGKERVVGAVAFQQKFGFWEVWTIEGFARQFGMSLLVTVAFAGALGAIIGSITTRGLAKRLGRLSKSARAWGQGDFTSYINDQSGDELGYLAQGLNYMAAKLQDLLEESQRISVIEERNRLARDLHDSVKQGTFAASAQLGAALARNESNPAEAQLHVLEAEKILHRVREDLTDLIRELRPIALKGGGLPTAIREYAQDCANQTGIEIEVSIQGERALQLEIEHSLFRILQGALANVTRHSQSTRALVLLVYDSAGILLTVSDNGRGFEIHKNQEGIGMRSMRERVELLGGELSIESRIGEGTEVTVRCAC